MTRLLDICPEPDKQTLLTKFKDLARMCLPSRQVLQPSFSFKSKEEFSDRDTLTYGRADMAIAPHEIREYTYLDRQSLRDANIDFIKAGNQRWFYNTWELDGNFFSEDGQKKVRVEFNLWMDAEKIWSIPGVTQAMRSVLTACAGDTFPTEAEAQKFFTPKLCQKIYQHQASDKSIKQAVLEVIEPLRKQLTAELVRNYAPVISRGLNFKKYVKTRPTIQTRPVQEQVNEYLKKNKNAVYLLSEKFGLIKGANKAIHYQAVRDSVRHPQEVQALLAQPQKVYDDFCTILMIPKESKKFRSFKGIIKNLETATNLEYMSEILDIISIYEDTHLKRKNPAYWQDLVNKGIVDPTEVPYLRTMVPACTDVAHVNPGADASKKRVLKDAKLLEIALNMQTRHEQKQAKETAKIQQWIKNASHIV